VAGLTALHAFYLLMHKMPDNPLSVSYIIQTVYYVQDTFDVAFFAIRQE
jgi:hypothetical protein